MLEYLQINREESNRRFQCKDALFNLQPLGQISDDSVQEKRERVLGAIDGLDYDTMVDAGDDNLYNTWRKLRQDRKKGRATNIINEERCLYGLGLRALISKSYRLSSSGSQTSTPSGRHIR